MCMYNKRNMGFLLAEMKKGQHPYLKDAIKYLNEAENNLDDDWVLKMAKLHLDHAIPQLAKRDRAGWRRELLLNYYLNLELAHYKKKDESYTKWTVFRAVAKENGWKNILSFMDKIDQYFTSQEDTDHVETEITAEHVNKIKLQYAEEILPFIREHLQPVDRYQAELRLKQRLDLLQKKVVDRQIASFDDWLKEKRTASGLSLQQLAERTGYSAAYIYRIEKGTRKNPSPKVVTKIVQALGYDPEIIVPMFFSDDIDIEEPDGGGLELLDWLKFATYTVAGKTVSEEKKKILSEIVRLITEKDVLRGEKMTELKRKIREFQK